LNNSYVESIRNLGSSFEKLNILWACNCSINELDGICSFNSLKKLYINKNLISDLYSISMLENLETLNIEGNLVSEVEQLEYLALCQSLNNLTIRHNPITKKLKIIIEENNKISKQHKIYAYNQVVSRLIPSITILDGMPIEKKKLDLLTDDEFKQIIKKTEELTIESVNPVNVTSSNKYYDIQNEEEQASELTYGTTETVCGNPALFLRSRKQELKNVNESTDKGRVIEIKNYSDKFEHEEKNEDLYDKTDTEDSYKTNKDVTSDKKKKNNQIKKKVSSEISGTKNEKKNEDKDYESIIGKYDITFDKINDQKTNLSIFSEKRIKDKIDKTIINEYEKKKSKKVKQRSKSNTISNSILSKESDTVNSITSLNNTNTTTTTNNNNNKILHIKPRQLHKRSSTTEPELNKHLNSNLENAEDQLLSGTDVFIAFPKNSITKSYYISKKYNKINLPFRALDNLCDLKKPTRKNVIIKKINVQNNTNNFDDLAFINSKKDNILIPHPPLEPIPIQDNCQRPTSVPLIRRRMYKKK